MTQERYLAPVAGGGDDANDGLTPLTPWLTFTKLSNWINSLPSNELGYARIAKGTYLEWVGGSGLDMANANTGVHVKVFFEPGTIVDMSQCDTKKDGISMVNSPGNFYDVHLNGAIFYGHQTSSANGIGTTNAGILNVFGKSPDGVNALFTSDTSQWGDGLSGHGTSTHCFIMGCTFRNCAKAPLYHVNDAGGFIHVDCEFWEDGATDGFGGNQGLGPIHTYFRCKFVTDSTAAPSLLPQNARYIDCEIGKIDRRAFAAGNLRGDYPCWFIDSFVCMSADGAGNANFVSSWGQWDTRMRGTREEGRFSAVNSSFQRNQQLGATTDCWAGSFSDGTSAWHGGQGIVIDCILQSYQYVISASNADQEAAIQANWRVKNPVSYLNVGLQNRTLDVVDDPTTGDPNTGSLATTEAADWGFASPSICEDAGWLEDVGFEAPPATPIVPSADDVRLGVAVGQTTGLLDLPSMDDVREFVDFDQMTRTGNLALPPSTQVLDGVGYGTDGIEMTGQMVLPAQTDVRLGVLVGVLGATGNVRVPPIDKVEAGYAYDASDSLTGTLDPGAGGVVPDPADVRQGVSVGEGGLGTLIVPAPSDVRRGVPVDAGAGNCRVPMPAQVLVGYAYDANDSVIGTLDCNASETIPSRPWVGGGPG